MRNRIIKFILSILMLSLLVVSSSCKKDPVETKKDINQYILNEEKACFDFFWETQNINPLLGGCGLIPDRFPSNGLASIASVGFGLASFIIGVKNNWITKEEGFSRAKLTLEGMKKLDRVNGFYYHFYHEKVGIVAPGSEVSNIDTSIFLCGALVAGSYFGGDVLSLALEIYDEVNFPWFINPKSNNFYMSYDANTKSFAGEWDFYAEQLMMYFLLAGARVYKVEDPKIIYNSFRRNIGKYKEYSFINSWYGSLFTYQFSHAFIDFRNIIDSNGVNWFENSTLATIANYQFCQDNKEEFLTFNEKSWGITACDTPTGYSGLLGTTPSGNNNITYKNDGTIALAGSIGSLVFLPDKVIPCFKYFSTILDGKLIGDYGFYDSYNILKDKIWIAKSVIGIDKGISILMIENYRSELIWENFMKLDIIQNAIKDLGFTYE